MLTKGQLDRSICAKWSFIVKMHGENTIYWHINFIYISEAILMIALRRDNTCNIRQKEGISMKTIRIGGGQGFWGDLIDAPIIMAKEDNVDYICCDYLAELTLSIMRRQQEKRLSLIHI